MERMQKSRTPPSARSSRISLALLTLVVPYVPSVGQSQLAPMSIDAERRMQEQVRPGTVYAAPGWYAPRHFVDVRFSQAWSIGGDAADTTFLLPLTLASTKEHFEVYDAIARVVVALNPKTGRVAWRFGKSGRGPNEFGGVATLHPKIDGGLFVLDQGNMRLTSISEDGRPGARVEYEVGANPRGVCPLPRGELRLNARIDRELERIRYGQPRPELSELPWPELAGQPSLVRQSKIFGHPSGNVCLLTLSFGPVFALVDSGGTRATGSWIEAVPLARAHSPAKGSWRLDAGSVLSATSAAGIGDSFAILFEGSTNQKLRVLDFYATSDGRYLFSTRIPFQAKQMTFGHSLLLLAGETSDGEPFVRALRATPSLEGLVKDAIGASGGKRSLP